MEITIENIKINENQIEAIMNLKAETRKLSGSDWSRDNSLSSAIEERVIGILTNEFLKQNMSRILNSVDVQSVINSITLRAAAKMDHRG